MRRRALGSGSYFQRGDGLWCFAVDLGGTPRRKRVITSKSRDALEVKVAAAIASGAIPAPTPRTIEDRRVRIRAARVAGTHTAAEWAALVRAHPKVCCYCDTELNVFNGTKDHIVPVSRGGSDGIDNLDYVCWQCNDAKRARFEYTYDGPRPRPFRPHPARTKEWAALQEWRDRRGIA